MMYTLGISIKDNKVELTADGNKLNNVTKIEITLEAGNTPIAVIHTTSDGKSTSQKRYNIEGAEIEALLEKQEYSKTFGRIE